MKHLLLVATTILSLSSYGQLQTFVGDVSILMTPSFLGTDYVVSNAQFTGNPQAVGSFISDTTNLGRLDDISTNGLDLIGQIRLIYDNYAFDTEILAASVRHPMHIINCAELGADVATCPLKAIQALANHPLTDSGLATFLADYAKGNA